MSTGAHVGEGDVMVILVRHRAFVKGDARGLKADFSFKDISGVSFTKEKLEGVSFKGANLAKGSFKHCDLSGSDFFGADLDGADLSGSNLAGADFRGANLHRATLSNTNLRGADFRISSAVNGTASRSACLSEAKIDHAILCQANLSDCDMSGADLVDADLSGSDLSQTVLLGADLSGASLNDARLSNTVLELSRLTEHQIGQIGSTDGIAKPTYKEISADEISRLVKSHGQWIVTGGAKGKRLDLNGENISGMKIDTKSLAGARMRKCNLSGIDFREKILDMVDFSYSDLSQTNLTGTSLRGTNLRSANLSNSILCSARFDQMPLEANRQWPSNLGHAILCGADLTGASFAGSIMTKTDVRGCSTSHATFIGVDLTTAKIDNVNCIASGNEKRGYLRYSEPELFVKCKYGAFTAVSWSVGGVCIKYFLEERMEIGEELWASIVAKENPPPRQTQFTVIRDNPEKGVTYLAFSCISDEVRKYIDELAIKGIQSYKNLIVANRAKP